MRCVICPITHVPNSIFCDECGAYLLQGKELGTSPLDITQVKWLGEGQDGQAGDRHLPETRPLAIRLRISSQTGKSNPSREVQIALARPIRLGRSDPIHDIFPEIDLSQDQGRESGVSREHTCIFQQDNAIMLEDLASTNGTLLNGKRLDPYIPEILRDGDQFQMGMLVVRVSFNY